MTNLLSLALTSVTLCWSNPPENRPDLSSYIVSLGNKQQLELYSFRVSPTNNSCIVSNLYPGNTYYITVKACTLGNLLESSNSIPVVVNPEPKYFISIPLEQTIDLTNWKQFTNITVFLEPPNSSYRFMRTREIEFRSTYIGIDPKLKTTNIVKRTNSIKAPLPPKLPTL